ncbi:hypothetical protein E3A20_22160, partial [Planctomyces bekefii]
FVMMRRPKAKLPLASANRVAKISVAVPESSAAGFPGGAGIQPGDLGERACAVAGAVSA